MIFKYDDQRIDQYRYTILAKSIAILKRSFRPSIEFSSAKLFWSKLHVDGFYGKL